MVQSSADSQNTVTNLSTSVVPNTTVYIKASDRWMGLWYLCTWSWWAWTGSFLKEWKWKKKMKHHIDLYSKFIERWENNTIYSFQGLICGLNTQKDYIKGRKKIMVDPFVQVSAGQWQLVPNVVIRTTESFSAVVTTKFWFYGRLNWTWNLALILAYSSKQLTLKVEVVPMV